jgi:hypothetical protein
MKDEYFALHLKDDQINCKIFEFYHGKELTIMVAHSLLLICRALVAQ